MASAPELKRTVAELSRAGFAHVIVDLRGLSFLDSSGIRLLLDLVALAREDSLRLELIPGPPQVQQVLELTGTLRLLPFQAHDGR